MERFIFDLDGTLLTGDFNEENEYFKEVLDLVDAEKFISMKYSLLMKYESLYLNYNIKELSLFLSKNSKVDITSKMITDWIEVNANMKDTIEDGVIEALEYLKEKGKSLAVLTNWFSKTQIQRLKRANIYEYFDDVYCGDIYLKPNLISYVNASGIYEYEDCVMIGDNLVKDVIVPKILEMNTIYYNKDNNSKENCKTIKSLKKIKEIY